MSVNAKEYLQKAFRLDQRINSKLQQIESLNALAEKCTTTLTGMPHSQNSSTSAIADTVVKIVSLQVEINKDIDKLVDLKQEIMKLIKSVSNAEYQTLLEERYLCFLSWEQISVDMNYSIQYAFHMHKMALKDIEEILKVQSK